MKDLQTHDEKVVPQEQKAEKAPVIGDGLPPGTVELVTPEVAQLTWRGFGGKSTDVTE